MTQKSVQSDVERFGSVAGIFLNYKIYTDKSMQYSAYAQTYSIYFSLGSSTILHVLRIPGKHDQVPIRSGVPSPRAMAHYLAVTHSEQGRTSGR